MGKSTTKNNHYLSRFMANNFRTEKGKPLYTLNCMTGIVSNRNTSEDKLFAKKHLWSQEIEDAFDKMENHTASLIKEVLGMPFNVPSITGSMHSLNSRYKEIAVYLHQTQLLQISNRDTPLSFQEESSILNALNIEDVPNNIGDVRLITYHPVIVKDKPLIVFDNAFSVFLCPPHPQEKNAGSAAFFMPISESKLLFWGNNWQLYNFASKYPFPHKLNLYKILLENKECLCASQNKQYLDYLSKEYKFFQFKQTGSIPSSIRKVL